MDIIYIYIYTIQTREDESADERCDQHNEDLTHQKTGMSPVNFIDSTNNLEYHPTDRNWLPSGKRLRNYAKSPFLMGKSTISMAIFNSYVKLPEGSNHS